MLTRTIKRGLDKRITQSCRNYQRPIPAGKLPVYDLALEVLAEDKKRVQRELQQLRSDKSERNAVDQKEYEKRIKLLEILEGSNDPEVRYNFENGNIDMSKPYYRYLAEKNFLRGGRKDKLLERLHQMNVVPDVVPSFVPTVELVLDFPKDEQAEGESAVRPVIAGSFVRPGLTFDKPSIGIKIFDGRESLYSLLIVDPDVPDADNEKYTNYLHFLKSNLKLSANTTKEELEKQLESATVGWMPPHPAQGTKYHRYTVLLVEQTNEIQLSDVERHGFDSRKYIESMDGRVVGGHMWRAVHDVDSSKVFKEILKINEPIYK